LEKEQAKKKLCKETGQENHFFFGKLQKTSPTYSPLILIFFFGRKICRIERRKCDDHSHEIMSWYEGAFEISQVVSHWLLNGESGSGHFKN
jgi:hypothetical protein